MKPQPVERLEKTLEPRFDHLHSQLLEAEYFTDDDYVLLPANIVAIVD